MKGKAISPVDVLLVEGGDPRLTLDPVDNMNSYGCRPVPRPEAIAFASTTASSISERAYKAVSQAWFDLVSDTAHTEEQFFENRIERLRQSLKDCLLLENTDVIFSPSGTDGQLIALFIARALLGRRITSVIVGSNETGSGTAFTARGQHFNTRSAQGAAVKKGEPITGLAEEAANIDIPLRDTRGSVCSLEETDTAVISAIAESIGAGSKVLLQIMDSSKLGWRSPSQKCLREVAARWPKDVLIVIDACQMRLGRKRLKEYLSRGYIVLLTGSKFFTAPPFCGALLVPSSVSAQMATVKQVPAGLGDYTNRSDWPLSWDVIRAALPPRVNFGQWLRWEAALAEMQAYFDLPQQQRLASLRSFAVEAAQQIGHSDALRLLPEQSADPSDDIDDEEMAIRTVFPFTVNRGGQPLSVDDCKKIYQALNRDVSASLPPEAVAEEKRIASQPCHIGQPVALPDGTVLRISAGARTVTGGWKPEDIRAVIDKIEVLLKYWNRK